MLAIYVSGADAGNVAPKFITSAGDRIYQASYIVQDELLRSAMKIVTSSQQLLARRKTLSCCVLVTFRPPPRPPPSLTPNVRIPAKYKYRFTTNNLCCPPRPRDCNPKVGKAGQTDYIIGQYGEDKKKHDWGGNAQVP